MQLAEEDAKPLHESVPCPRPRCPGGRRGRGVLSPQRAQCAHASAGQPSHVAAACGFESVKYPLDPQGVAVLRCPARWAAVQSHLVGRVELRLQGDGRSSRVGWSRVGGDTTVRGRRRRGQPGEPEHCIRAPLVHRGEEAQGYHLLIWAIGWLGALCAVVDAHLVSWVGEILKGARAADYGRARHDAQARRRRRQ